jgi:uncharacterized membrane protein
MMGGMDWDARWHMVGQSGTAGLWLLVVVLAVLLAGVTGTLTWALWGAGRTRRSQLSGDASPGHVLDDRLARGEIDEDTYLRTRAMLGIE